MRNFLISNSYAESINFFKILILSKIMIIYSENSCFIDENLPNKKSNVLY